MILKFRVKKTIRAIKLPLRGVKVLQVIAIAKVKARILKVLIKVVAVVKEVIVKVVLVV